MQKNRYVLNNISKERIKDEFCKIMSYDNSFYGLRLLYINKLLPLVSPLHEKHMPFRPFDADVETKIADFYYEYDPKYVEKELRWLKFSNDEIKRIMFFLNLIPTYMMLLKIGSTQAYVRFIAHIKNNSPQDYSYTLEQFLKLVRSDKTEISKYLFEECADVTVLSRKEMNINGDDLINIGVPVGPEIKRILDGCYQMILDEPYKNNLEDLLKIAENIK
jgi:tRNA nucleotidyltransferase/poly(A) polymerase